MLEGKVLIVTGGASGIGREAVEVFSHLGACIVLADSNVAGQAVAADLTGRGGRVEFCQTDVSREPDVKRLVETVVSRFGRLDGAFNNAAVLGGQHRLEQVTSEEFERIIRVNLVGVFLCMKYEIAAMIKSGGGSIVNNSAAGSMNTMPGNCSYIAAKAGVNGLTQAASTEARHTGVRVNAILPGQINTPMVASLIDTPAFTQMSALNAIAERHSIGRFGVPRDVADTAAWLLSDLSSFINGALIPVDGGFTAR